MLRLVEPIIILSSFTQPIFVVPQKPTIHYEIIESEPLPKQNINDVLTSEEMLMHIINEIKFDAL